MAEPLAKQVVRAGGQAVAKRIGCGPDGMIDEACDDIARAAFIACLKRFNELKPDEIYVDIHELIAAIELEGA